jgi:hypothetical protein
VPAAFICSAVEVIAKRGVIAYWSLPLPLQRSISAFVSS